MKYKKGFTLIEMLIVIALIAAVSILMYSFFGQGFNLYAVESKSAEEQTNLRNALSDITNRARLTKPSDINYDSGILNIGADAYTLDGSSMKRNGTAIASGISVFNVVTNSGFIEIELVNASGKKLSTSLSLIE